MKRLNSCLMRSVADALLGRSGNEVALGDRVERTTVIALSLQKLKSVTGENPKGG